MDRYAMNRCGCQPQRPAPQPRPQCAPAPCKKEESKSPFDGLDALPLAMGYVPCQSFHTTFDLCKALQIGTIFPELCKPFCGQRRCRR
ncbi:MAG: spore coat associated protein CotJA [Lachnospiraceae bacterium]|nr:spore coat associated protein CotJA [Lachnospiraceae bacterium]